MKELPKSLPVKLTAPVAHRRLVDHYDGAARLVLDAAAVPTPSYLPTGYQGGDVTWPDSVRVGITSPTTVQGHPATVSYTPGFEEDILVAWSVSTTQAVTVYQTGSNDGTHRALSVAELLRIANGLH